MSWRDNKKPGGGYSRGGGRGYRRNRGGAGNSRQGTSENQDEDGGHRQYSGYRGGGGGYRGRPYKRTQANCPYDGKRTRYEVGKRLKEEDIGVTEFIGSHKRFAGIIKERYGDFHVHEISCDGEICKLTNEDIPPEPQDLTDMDKLMESLPQDVKEKLEAFVKVEGDTTTTEIDVTEMDKESRRNIHTIAKKIPTVESETVERDDRKIIVLAKRNKEAVHNYRGDRRVDWTSRGGNYCHFLLHKVNMDTMDALNQLAVKLRLKTDLFHYAGTKDRRARTTQWVSLKKISPASIHNAAKQVRGAYVGNFKFSKDPLRLGLLNGNRFRIALRSVNGTDEEISRAVESLRDNGFINYYGLQRFGTIAAIPTHEIGKALLQGNWERAIELILKPRVGEQQRDMTEARKIYEKTRNASLALRPIARSGKIEAKLLQSIVTNGEKNPQGSLDGIPRNARLMYIHAYQSFVWNHIVSRRIKEFGPKPIVGDLVYVTSDSKNTPEAMDYGLLQSDEQTEPKVPEEINEETARKESPMREVKDDEETPGIVENKEINDEEIPVDEISEMTVSKAEDEKIAVNTTKIGTENETSLDDPKDDSSLPAVKPLTEDDLPKYTLADVVMPKPGWKVTYPSYAKPWFDEFLARDDLTTDLRQKNKKYSLGGGYRTILETPGDLTWKIARYNGYHDDLILCDVDEMRGMKPREDEAEGKHKALILEFSLKSSTYATMALREILEHDTSAHTQAAQSAANQAQDSLEAGKKMETNGESVDEVEEEIAREKDGNFDESESAKSEKTDDVSANKTDDRKTESAMIVEETAGSPKKISKQGDDLKTESAMVVEETVKSPEKIVKQVDDRKTEPEIVEGKSQSPKKIVEEASESEMEVVVKQGDDPKTETEIIEPTDVSRSPKKISKEANDSQMEVVEDEANIPKIDEGRNKMETESTEPSDVTEKIE